MIRGLAIVYLLLGIQAIWFPTVGYAQVHNQAFSRADEAKFYEELRDEIQENHKSLVKMKANVESKGKRAANNERQEFEEAKLALEVKIILFRNFYDTPSIYRPEVREKLLELFKKPQVTMDDLKSLQELVGNP